MRRPCPAIAQTNFIESVADVFLRGAKQLGSLCAPIQAIEVIFDGIIKEREEEGRPGGKGSYDWCLP